MPGIDPKRGDVYKVDGSVVKMEKPDPRPVACVKENPGYDLWRAMGRSASRNVPADCLPSPKDESLGFTKEGWWSWRYLFPISRRWTGTVSGCQYQATMVDPLLTEVMDHYGRAPKDIRVRYP